LPFCSIDLLCFLVVVLVVVESGDSLVARVVGEVFRCDLCDPCMMLSFAFILVKKKIYSGLYFILVSKDLRAGHYIWYQSLVQTLGSLCLCCPHGWCCVV
jgi:hypothetical protein